MLDASGSIRRENFALMKRFVADVVGGLNVADDRSRVALVTYSSDVQPRFQLDSLTSRQAVIDAVDAVPYARGTTDTAAAIRYAYETVFKAANGDRSNRPNIVVVMTDGGSNDKRATRAAAYEARKRGIHVIVIGIGDWTDEYELVGMASYPYGSNYVKVGKFAQLDSQADRITQLLCDSECEAACNSLCCVCIEITFYAIGIIQSDNLWIMQSDYTIG